MGGIPDCSKCSVTLQLENEQLRKTVILQQTQITALIQERDNSDITSIHDKRLIAELRAKLHEAQKLSIYDHLVDEVVTRREFEIQVGHSLSALQRAEHSVKKGNQVSSDDDHFSIAFFDLDDLKKTNDEFGHLAGDILLQSFGSLLKKHFKRDGDLVSRFGGDEFFVLLPGVIPLQKAEGVAKDFIEYLTDIQIHVPGKSGEQYSIPVRASVGVASTSEGLLTINDLVRVADERMYKHKNKS